MRIEISINDRKIGDIGVQNMTPYADSPNIYDVKDLRGIEDGNPPEKIGSIPHNGEDGAVSLAAKVLDRVVKEENLD